ncbi:MAG: chromate resistance protein [Polyangiaceae bacterium]|jgi:hypothetical protein|nr:chromate resistance protein [Polyangiaceae bacterium]
MLWVTRRTIRVNRTATAWLIRRFIDPDATLLFVTPDEVASAQEREGAVGFDAPGATYPHRDDRGRCSFEALVEERCADDPALRELARIVHGADLPDEHPPLESAGLRAISFGFPLVANDDQAVVERATFLYDALYASLRHRCKEQP